MHVHVGHNMPGYLPQDGPSCYADASAALDAWRWDVRRHIDDVTDDGVFLDADTRQNLTTVSDVEAGDVSLDVEGERYWIEHTDGDASECDLRDVLTDY